MASQDKKRLNFRIDVNDREKKISRIEARSGSRNQAQAIDHALDAYFALEKLLCGEVEDLEDRIDGLNDMGGDAFEVRGDAPDLL